MDSFETPYEDEPSVEFIDCAICEKSIRGDALYKIHLTTPGHLKKEDALVAAGHIVREHTVPFFEDILQYLDYLDLDEPIIGLNYLVEVPHDLADQQTGPRYTCKLCFITASLLDIVNHVIGRKHRQKYMELKRPDLVTWDTAIANQGGKLIRARAEIIERQDGRGAPLPIKKQVTVGKPNNSRVPSRQQRRDRNTLWSLIQRDRPPHPPELQDYQDDYPPQGRGNRPGFSNSPSFHPDERYAADTDRRRHPREDTGGCERREEAAWGADHSDSDAYGGRRTNSGRRQEYEDEYVEEPQMRSEHADYYPEDAPRYIKAYPKKDPLKEFYAQEVRSGRVCPGERQTSHDVYQEVPRRHWSLDKEAGTHESRTSAGGRGSSEPEAKRRRFPTPVESDRSHFMIDYQHEVREPYQEEAVSSAGPSSAAPPNYQRSITITRPKPEIPDPFRQFLKGPADVEGHGKRKRKSRFSDATPKEVQNAKEMFRDDCSPLQNLQFGGRSSLSGVPFEPKVSGTQQPDLYTEPQSPHGPTNYQRGGSEPGDVLDMLNNIEIENTEEAEFLKGKLCNLLKEFKAIKSQKNMQKVSQGSAVISKDSNSFTLDMQPSPHHQYERNFRGASDLRQPEELYIKEDHRRRVHEQKPDEWHQEYNRAVCGESRRSNRRLYEEVFGRPETYPTPPPTHPDEPEPYPERFREPLRSRDYRPANEEFFDSRSAAPPLHMEQAARMHRNPQYSNSLDKITSTLLELMARKQS